MFEDEGRLIFAKDVFCDWNIAMVLPVTFGIPDAGRRFPFCSYIASFPCAELDC